MRKLLIIYILFAINIIILPSEKNMVNIGVGSIDYIEIVIWSTFIIGSYYIFSAKLRPLRKIKYLMTYKQQVAFFAFSTLFVVSLIFGIINHNKYVFSQMRGIGLFILTFIIFTLLLDFKNPNTKKYFKYVCFLFIAIGISVVLSYTSSTFTELYSQIL